MARLTRDTWVGIWVAVAGLLISVGVSYYFYDQSRAERDLVVVEARPRTEIVTSDRIQTAPLKVIRNDGVPVTGDVTALKVYVWNAGRQSVRSENLLQPLVVSFRDPSVRILDQRWLKPTRTVVQPSSGLITERSVQIGFRILEQDDGFPVQITFQGPHDTPIDVSGVVEGMREIRRTGGASDSWIAFRSVLYVLGFMTVGIAVLVTIVVIQDKVQSSVLKLLPAVMLARLQALGNVLGIAFIALIIVGFMIVLFFAGREQRVTDAASEAPPALVGR